MGWRYRDLREELEDAIEDARDAYGSARKDIGKRARKAWSHRDDIADDLADDLRSYGECAADAVYNRFRRDPVGTLAVGAIMFWLAARLARR